MTQVEIPTSGGKAGQAHTQPSPRHLPTVKPLNFGVVVFPAFQALDMFGPLDAFNLLSKEYKMNLYIIAATLDPPSTGYSEPLPNGKNAGSKFAQSIVPTHTFATAPPLDVLLVPGGHGTRLPGIEPVVDFVRDRFASLQYLITVCTGAGIAAKAGVLDGRRATTNKYSWAETVALRPAVQWVHRARWVEDGNVWTSSGISAGIDVAFAWMRAVYGDEVATRIADWMEYVPVMDPDDDPFADRWADRG